MKKKVLIVFLMSLLVFGFGTDAIAKKKKMTKEEKQAAKLAKKEKKIESFLGTNSNWKPAVFANIRKGMTCDQVNQFFNSLNCADSSPFKNVSKGLGTISGYTFYFQNRRLYSVTIIFGTRLLDEKSFTQALMNVIQRKWGPIQDPQNISWKNHEYEKISMKYNKTHWELEFQMPSFDPGDVDVNSFNEEMLRSELQKFLGGPENCLPAYFTQFPYHMPWEEANNMFPDLEYDPSKSLNYCKISVKGHPLVAGLRLRFDSGLLEHVTVVFHWQIPRELFKSIAFDVMKEKYGANIKDEDAVKDKVMAYTKGCGYITREWGTNRWELKMTLPKTGGSKVNGGGTRSASTSAKKTKISNYASLAGNWKLVAARQGSKTESMTGGTLRSIEFTADQQFKMKENGKVVNSNYYKISNQYIYFTAGKSGKATKQLGTIISLQGNKLVLMFAGQSIQMIFEKM
jgi:hypothetical protein